MRQELNTEQTVALEEWARLHGRNYKSALRQAWMTGDYAGFEKSNFLQQIRNTFGPSWLESFRPCAQPDLQKMTFAQMAVLVQSIWVEMKRRNPIGINFYEGPFHLAIIHLVEIGLGEEHNPTCEAGPGIDQ
jgi:hypothetical protein